MQLTPMYDNPAFFRLDLPLGDPSVPMLRQRRRLATLLGELDDAQWATGSRCAKWSVRDVIAHLGTTNQFWVFAIGSALAGEPTRFLADFDPVSSPAELVDAGRSSTTTEVREQFVESTEALAAAVDRLDDDAWSKLGEAPPGHIPLRAVALHALWDGWVHERDIVLPLGLAPVEEPDEVTGCLVYATALSPAFAVARGATREGAIGVAATDPDTRFVVEVGESVAVRAGEAPRDALHLTGSAVDLIEALSIRAPLPCPVDDSQRWLLAGLSRAFDR
jgi:uncharacterized protein (TIGR03083 family)